MLKSRLVYSVVEGAEVDCPNCGSEAIANDSGVYCPDCSNE